MAQHFATVNIGDTERVRFEVEEDYSSVGSYALDTEEQTSLAKQYEQARIESGEWIPLIAWHEHRCPCCGQWSGTSASAESWGQPRTAT